MKTNKVKLTQGHFSLAVETMSGEYIESVTRSSSEERSKNLMRLRDKYPEIDVSGVKNAEYDKFLVNRN